MFCFGQLMDLMSIQLADIGGPSLDVLKVMAVKSLSAVTRVVPGISGLSPPRMGPSSKLVDKRPEQSINDSFHFCYIILYIYI